MGTGAMILAGAVAVFVIANWVVAYALCRAATARDLMEERWEMERLEAEEKEGDER